MRKIAFGVVIIGVILVISVVTLVCSYSKVNNSVELKKNLECKFFEKNDFDSQIANAAIDTKLQEKKLFGGVVPHHLLAGDMIASFFKSLDKQKIDTIVIVGPNHKRAGQYKIIKSNWDFSTPFGMLQTDNINLKENRLNGLIGSDFDIIENEHSVSGLVPFVKYYLPDAKVLPIILSGGLDRKGAEVLGEAVLNELKGKNFFILGSIDFSHYLDIERANKMDERTIASIKDWNKDAIAEMTNDNIDSPPTMIFMLHTMKLLGADNIYVAGHSNSALIAKSQYDNTTSYFTLGFYK